MQTRPFGSTGRAVSAVGQGTWNIETAGRRQAVAALRAGLDAGLTHIDTAEMYGNGEAESIVGEAINGRRDDVFLVTKVLPSNASRQGTVDACERSLRRLGTDRVDCYLLHWAGRHPLADTVAAFESLVHDGKILSWGVSNFDESELAGLWQIPGGRQVACNQVLYHLGQRAIEHAVLPWCTEHGVALVAYSPRGQDQFPGRDDAGARALQAVADRHGVTPRQVALAFLLRDEHVFAIPKAARLEHVRDNAAAGGLVLTVEDIATIDRAFPRGRKPRSLPML